MYVLYYSQIKKTAQRRKENDITKAFESYVLMPAFQENETCEFDEMEKRIDALVYELVQKQ